MPERSRYVLLWAVVLGGSGAAVFFLGRFGANLVAFGLLYAALATGWNWMRATGLFSFGQAAFFGVGALTQGWLVSTGRSSPSLALVASAVSGGLAALPLIPALRLGPAAFGLATLAYAILLKGLAGNMAPFGTEGFLLPRTPGFDGAAPLVLAALGALALSLCLGYAAFLGRPSGRAATAIRQSPETTLSLGIDLVAGRWLPLTICAAATAVAGALYAHLAGSVETAVVFSSAFSVLPIVLGMLGGALHPLGGILGTLVLYPLDELLIGPALPHAHALAYGLVLVGLLLLKPGGLLAAPSPGRPAARAKTALSRREPFAIAVRHLTVRRNGAAVLSDLSFDVEPGQVLRVLGPNGAGKTSLLLAIAGRLQPAGGAVFFGRAVAPRGAAARVRLGLARAFQAPHPFPEWTVRQNVSAAAERAGNLGAVDGLLEDLQLTALGDRLAGRLSVGEGKRLEVARVLALRPAVLLLDEPLAGLSPEAAGRVTALIERVRREGAAIIWVEHGPAPEVLASHLLVLDGGRAAFFGAPSGWEAARHAPAS